MLAPKLQALTPPPLARTLCTLALTADKCTTVDQLKQVHAQMIVSAVVATDIFAVSRLLFSCALSPFADLSHASRIFRSTPHPNSFMWNTLIRAQPHALHALSLYVAMRRSHVIPGKHTFPFLLKACSHFRSLNSSKQIHVHVIKFGLDSDSHVANALVRCYSLSANCAHARLVFDEMPEKSSTLWTTMICGYAQNFCSNEALKLFEDMVREGFEPSGATLASVLSACARSGCLELGEKIHEFMEVRGVEHGEEVILGTALVHMYAKNGVLAVARKLFDEMRERNVFTWNAMICGLGAYGYVDDALDLFEKMKRDPVVVPNHVTFVGVLSACCHAGLVDVGREFFHLMKLVYGIEQQIEHYGCLVDLLGRGGRLQEAVELVKGMPWKPDVVILGALLAASRNSGNTEVAERVMKEILALEPQNDGVHVALSNMYAEAGQWQEVLRLRKTMKEERVKKAPGWSLVAT